MVVLVDDAICAMITCILTVSATCLTRYSVANENDHALLSLVKDVQRICGMYLLEREGLSQAQREELHKTIASVGIEFGKELEGPRGDELRELVARGEVQTKMERELLAKSKKM
jgi:hypothetical protein